MNKIINSLLMFLLVSSASFAKNNESVFVCSVANASMKALLNITEASDDLGKTISSKAEVTLTSKAPESFPNLIKESQKVPGYPFRSIEVWTATGIKITGYFDHSFPGRAFAVDLEIPQQSKMKGICEF